MEPIIQHWLVAVARAAGLEGASELDVPSETELNGAWALVAMKTAVSGDELTGRVAAHYRIDIADLASADPHANRLVPASVARKLNVLPLRYSDRTLVVATADPVSMQAERELGSIAGRTIHFEVASPEALSAAVEAAYPVDTAARHEIPPLAPEAGGGPVVLVVDDDPSMRVLLRSVFEKGDFRVVEAESGERALAILGERHDIALVTLDLEMGEMGGLAVLKKIRTRMATAALPVVVATGSHDPSVEMSLFEAGADDFVVKPVDPPRLLLRIQAVLRRRSPNPLAGLF